MGNFDRDNDVFKVWT